MSFDLLKELRQLKPSSLKMKGNVYATLQTLCKFVNQKDFLLYKKRLKEGLPTYGVSIRFDLTTEIISQESGFSIRAIKYHLEELKKLGYIAHKRYKKNLHLYTVFVDKFVCKVNESLSGGAKTALPENNQSDVVVQILQSGGAIHALQKLLTQYYIIINILNNIITNLVSTTTREAQKNSITNNKTVNKVTFSPVFADQYSSQDSLYRVSNTGDFFEDNNEREIAQTKSIDRSLINKEVGMRNQARFYAKEIRDKLVTKRKEFGLTFNQDEGIELDLIASRIQKLVDVEKNVKKAISLCHAVLDSRYDAIKKCKDKESRDKKLEFFCVQLLFVNDKTFNIARSSLKGDTYLNNEEDAKLKEIERKKRQVEWEKAKLEDEAYLALKEKAELATKSWVDDPKNINKLDASRIAQQRVENYERDFLSKE